MIDTLQELTEQYLAALQEYLRGAREESLQRAYELGRKAITEGVGVLEMAAIHNRSLAALFTNPLNHQEALHVAGQASIFFAESLSPFEMGLRGYREANARLQENLQQLKAAEKELQRQNQQLDSAHESAKAERQRYQELFDFAPEGYIVTDLEGTIQEANSPVANLLQIRKNLLPGRSLLDFVAEEEHGSFRSQLEKLQSGQLEKVEDWQVTVRQPGTNTIPASLRVGLVCDMQGKRVGLRWLMSDITERKRIEEERAQIRIREHVARAETEAARRFKFLAEASSTLVTSLDYGTRLANIAQFSVPYLGDCCFVHLIEDQVSVRQVAAAHADPAMADLTSKLALYWSNATKVSAPVAESLSATKPLAIPDISEDWLESFAGGAEPLAILREFHLKSALLVPLVARGRSLGTMIFARAQGGVPYSAEELALAEELARRCSLALDNARLHFQVVVERDKAEKASKAKDEFVAILSHELRTPLTTILGWARVLKKKPAILNDPPLRDGVQALDHNARNIARLVEDCLDLARITERKIQLQKEIADLNQVIRAALDATRDALDNKDLKFLIHLCPTELRVFGDWTRLEQVVVNLLANAFKYTEPGGVVSISSRQTGQEAEITVQDTGIGIDPEFLEEIFRPFQQGTRDWLASESGLGLGLTIARAIAQLHGGRLWAESMGRGCGSTFHLRIPLATKDQASIDQKTAPAPIPEKRKPLRILFVEDSIDVLNLMRLEMEELGHVVLTETNATSGLEVAKRERPDVIVSDIKMLGIDGYEFIKQLRQIPELASVPAIALTGFGLKQDIERALAAGYTAHLCKPVEVEQLTALFYKLTSA